MPTAELKESRALTCNVGDYRLAIPRSEVGQILDIDVAPRPPFASIAVAGMSVLDDDVVVLLAAVPVTTAPRVERRVAKAVMLVRERAGLRWAIEVDSTRGFESVWADDDPDDGQPSHPWTIPGLLEDGTSAVAIDLERLIAEVVSNGPGIASRGNL